MIDFLKARFLTLGVLAVHISMGCSGLATEIPYIQNEQDVKSFIPLDKKAIQEMAEAAKRDFLEDLATISAIELENKTFANTIQAWDSAEGKFSIYTKLFSALMYVLPEKEVRESASQAAIDLQSFYQERLSKQTDLYVGASFIQKNEKLSAEHRYFLDELILDFKDQGLNLPQEKREKIAELNQKIDELGQTFNKNINENNSFIYVKKEQLEGLPEDFIESLEKSSKGEYKLTCDYPVYVPVMNYCKSSEVRKTLSNLFSNRAYPQNIAILDQLIAKRDELAKTLGYSSFAQYQIRGQMAKTPQNAEKFIDELYKNVQAKASVEFTEVTQDLPEPVKLSPNHKLYDYDASYVFNQYKMKHYDIDEMKIAEYFPLEKTIENLFTIYQKFFSISIQELPNPGLWHEDVRLLQINDGNTKETLGFLLLDLFPRENKFSHACDCPIVPAYTSSQNKKYPALSLVIANFTKSTATKPSLLRYVEVSTFFHEFGHAIHDMLGRCDLMSVCGTNTKLDFVELPSQLLEEWLWDKDILRMVSSHYETGKPLPDETIDQMIKAKNFDSGTFVERQCFLSKLSLAYYADGAKKDTTAICRNLRDQMLVQYDYNPNGHFQASFGHLYEYGAQYYGYMWSLVYALDVFQKIKQEGLLNPKAGAVYVQDIIGRGGSMDPNLMLKNYLGREPNQKAFLANLGMEK